MQKPARYDIKSLYEVLTYINLNYDNYAMLSDDRNHNAEMNNIEIILYTTYPKIPSKIMHRYPLDSIKSAEKFKLDVIKRINKDMINRI